MGDMPREAERWPARSEAASQFPPPTVSRCLGFALWAADQLEFRVCYQFWQTADRELSRPEAMEAAAELPKMARVISGGGARSAGSGAGLAIAAVVNGAAM